MNNKQLMIEMHFKNKVYGLIPESTKMFMQSSTHEKFSELLKETKNFTISTKEGDNTSGLLLENETLEKIVVFEEVMGDVLETTYFVPSDVSIAIGMKSGQITISTT